MASVLVSPDSIGVLGVFNRWCKFNQLVPGMSRRVTCSDNAVAESLFRKLKKERSKRRIYVSRQEAKSAVFDDIEGFYNRVLRHSHLDSNESAYVRTTSNWKLINV